MSFFTKFGRKLNSMEAVPEDGLVDLTALMSKSEDAGEEGGEATETEDEDDEFFESEEEEEEGGVEGEEEEHSSDVSDNDENKFVDNDQK